MMSSDASQCANCIYHCICDSLRRFPIAQISAAHVCVPTIPVQCSGPLAGVVPPARRHRPAVGAAPDGSPAPVVPGGPD